MCCTKTHHLCDAYIHQVSVMGPQSDPTYARNNPLYHNNANGGSTSTSTSRRPHHYDDAVVNMSHDSRASRSRSRSRRPAAAQSNLPLAGHAPPAVRPIAGGGGHRRSSPHETPEQRGRDGRSQSRGRTSSRTRDGSHNNGGANRSRDDSRSSRGRRGVEDVETGAGYGDEDGDGDGSGSVVSGFSRMRETPQRHRDRGRSRSRSRGRGHSHSRSRSRGRPPTREGSRRAGIGMADVDLEDGREDSGAAFLKDFGGGSGRIGGSGSVGGTAAAAAAAGRGLEPAVKGCGYMTTHTFLKLVTFTVMVYYIVKLWTMHYDPSSGRLCSFK